MQQALAQRAFGAPIDIGSRNAVLEAGAVADRIDLPVDRGRDDVQQTALIKMDVRLDEAAADEMSCCVVGCRIRSKMRIDRNDRAVFDTDVDQLTHGPLRQLSSSDNLIHFGAPVSFHTTQ
jgi:hypothetical protein